MSEKVKSFCLRLHLGWKPDCPKEIGPKEEHTKHILMQLPKIKDKERILKASRGKESYKGVQIRLSTYFSKKKKKHTGKKGLERSI